MQDDRLPFADPNGPHFRPPETPPIQGWEEVAEGRYLPRRTRGSCVGRALG